MTNENRKFHEWQLDLENRVRAASDKVLIQNMVKCLKRRNKYQQSSAFAGRNMAIMDACYRAYKAKRCRTKSAALELNKIPWPWESPISIDYERYHRYLTLNWEARQEYFKYRGEKALGPNDSRVGNTSKKPTATAGVM